MTNATGANPSRAGVNGTARGGVSLQRGVSSAAGARL